MARGGRQLAMGARLLDRRRQARRAAGSDLHAQTAGAAGHRPAGRAAIGRHLLRPRPLGMERNCLPLARRLLGARPTQLRLGFRPLPLDARRLYLYRRLLGLLRQTPRRSLRSRGH